MRCTIPVLSVFVLLGAATPTVGQHSDGAPDRENSRQIRVLGANPDWGISADDAAHAVRNPALRWLGPESKSPDPRPARLSSRSGWNSNIRFGFAGEGPTSIRQRMGLSPGMGERSSFRPELGLSETFQRAGSGPSSFRSTIRYNPGVKRGNIRYGFSGGR